MVFAFEKLQVYQKALDFAAAVCRLTKAFPRGYFLPAYPLNRARRPPEVGCTGATSRVMLGRHVRRGREG